MRGLERFAPLAGLLFVLLLVVAVIIGGETPAADDSLREVIDYWNENKDQNIVASIIAAIATVPFLWFAGVLRSVLAAAEGPPARLASTAWGGAIVTAGGWLAIVGFNFVAADTAGDVAPAVTQTFSVLQADFFFPLAVGASVFLLAGGLAIVRSGVLPSWLGWAAIVLGVVCLTPGGFFAILLMLVWIIVLSVMLFQRSAAPPAPGVPGQVPGQI
jgi:hypothetical protein